MHTKDSLRRLMVLIIPAIILLGCFGEGDGKPKIAGTPQPPVVDNGDGYVLVFADEFDVDGAPSAANWNIETGYGPNNDGNGNNEWQLYTNSSDNVRVEGGNLVLSALCASPPCGVRDGTVTSGKVTTLDKVEFRYGRIEARIKPPVGKGAWPAFWSLGANHPDIGWPKSGEIDFMEMHNAFSNDRTTHFTMHWCDQSIQAPDECTFPEGWIFYTQNRAFNTSLGNDFHIFAADWNEDRIIGSIDGIPYFTRNIDPNTMDEFLKEFYMILNVAMGGTLGSDNQPPDGTEVFPQTMLVDYVRVYQCADCADDSGSDGFFVDFEDAGGPYTFNNFEGGVAFIADNPDMTGINPSAKVAQMQKFAGATFAGSLLERPEGFEVPQGSSFTAKVRSQRPVDVLFKVEGGAAAETTVTHGGTGWEELTFDLPGASGSYTGITFIFDFGTVGDADNNPDNWTFFVDDIRLIPGDDGGGPSPTTINFEDDGAPYTFNDFEGGVGFVTDNPQSNGINTSPKVAQMWKFAGGATFAGTTLARPLDVIAGSTITMKVWANRPTLPGPRVLFKLESSSPVEAEVMHGNTGWEELTFSLPGASGSYTGITFIFDNGTAGDSEGDPDNWTFYIDDITITPPVDDGGGGDPDDPTINFEDAGGPYIFNDFEGGVGFVTNNPFMTGINTSAKVAQMWKFAGAVFAGTTLATPLEVAAGSSFRMKVYSPRSVEVLFKLEGTPDVEASVTHGGTGWEELTFDLTSASGSYTGITFIFDLGIVGDAEGDPANWTFYIDDITPVPPIVGGDPNSLADFEIGGGPYVFNDFEGGVGSIVANPDPTGINTSDSVGQMQKFAGAVFAGSTLELAIEVVTGSSFTMQVWSQREVPVLFKLEGTPDVEATAMHGGSGWELLTFDLSSASGSYTGITLIFDLGVVGNAANDPLNWTFYFDAITVVPPDSGGGGPGMDVVVSDFEANPASYDFGLNGGFGGGAASVIANPQSNGINTSAQVGQMQKFAGEIFGGSTLTLTNVLDVPADSSFTMKVWSLRPVPVLMKLEGAVIAESSANHGGTGWEELTFTYTGFAGSVDGITLIFDLGVTGAAATDPGNWTFYFDDITLVGAGGGSSTSELADFEADPSSYNFGLNGGFGGGAASVIANPQSNGINTSAQVGQMLKYAGEIFGGSTLALNTAVDVPSGSSITMKVWSSRVVPVLLKLEGPVIAELSVNHGGSGWEVMIFDFPSFAGSVSGITQIYDLGVIGAAATDPNNWTFYFDDITLITSGGSR